jgi:uncharacterized protein DUF6883
VIGSRLPNADAAIIDERKITDYLLARHHPAGRAKAAFFLRFGFTAAAWITLRDALLVHARSARIVGAADTPFGRKYILNGPLATPVGRTPRVRAVWFIEIGEIAPRFVTAYPAPGARR